MSPSAERLLTASARAAAVWREGVTALVDLVFPPFCPVCQCPLGEGRRDPLCGPCWSRLDRVFPPWCRMCGRALAGAAGAHRADGASADDESGSWRCGTCRQHPPAFDYARSAVHYGGVAREALHAFKFGGRRALAAPLADLLIAMRPLLPAGLPDLLVPMPLHPSRERERGFNQSRLLARRVGRAWAVEERARAVARTVATRPQADLTSQERRANVRGAFTARDADVSGRHVLVVDDIFTTGSTADACARALRRAGASIIGVLTVARVD